MSVAFHADPIEVLKYGSNGLHFAEHILWNMTAAGVLHHTNATTFSSGEMVVFGSCFQNDLPFSMKHFFDGLIDLARCNMTKKITGIYPIEQKRVSHETNRINQHSLESRGPTDKMFIFNTDIVRSQYPIEYVWKILLEESRIGKVVVMANCSVSDKTIALFTSLANEFSTAWDQRGKRVRKTIALPLYHAPPFSMFHEDSLPPPMVIKYGELGVEFSPIERMIIASSSWGMATPYVFSVTLYDPPPYKRDHDGENLRRIYDWDNPFFTMPLLVSYEGSIDPKWVNELYSRSPNEIFSDHAESAVQKLTLLSRK